MSKSYDVRFCSCGHIHAIPYEIIREAVEKNEEVVLICGSCGTVTVIGADAGLDGYCMYSYELMANTKNNSYKEIMTVNDFTNSTKKAVNRVIYDKGIPVPMMTGYNANSFFNDEFYDMDYPDCIYSGGFMDTETLFNKIEDYKGKHKKVNMARFIRENPEDVIEAISHYIIRGLDFTGTKFEHK